MTNHFHLVVQTPEANLSRGMQWLNTAYAVWFNRHHERSGHLYGDRFKAFVIEKESYFVEVPLDRARFAGSSGGLRDVVGVVRVDAVNIAHVAGCLCSDPGAIRLANGGTSRRIRTPEALRFIVCRGDDGYLQACVRFVR